MDSLGAVEDAYRREWPGVVATLTRWTGDLGRAEDAAAEAVEPGSPIDSAPSGPVAPCE